MFDGQRTGAVRLRGPGRAHDQDRRDQRQRDGEQGFHNVSSIAITRSAAVTRYGSDSTTRTRSPGIRFGGRELEGTVDFDNIMNANTVPSCPRALSIST